MSSISLPEKGVWLARKLKERFYSHRLKASCATNGYLLDFYWKLGRDIEAKQYANTYGSGFYKNLSLDQKHEMPGVKGELTNKLALYEPVLQFVRKTWENNWGCDALLNWLDTMTNNP